MRVKKRCPGRSIKEIKDEYEGNDTLAGCGISSLCKCRTERCPDSITAQHSAGGEEEQSAAADTVDHQSTAGDGKDPVGDL